MREDKKFEALYGVPKKEFFDKPFEGRPKFEVSKGLGITDDLMVDLQNLKVDPDLDTTSLSLQFALSISNAFQSQSVISSISSVMTSGVNLAVQLGTMAASTGNPILAGIAVAASLADLFFGGGGNKLPDPTRPVDVRLVEIVGQAATTMLGITERRLIASTAGVTRGVDFRDDTRLMA